MALGELTKQFAKQALTDQVSDLLEPAKKPAQTPDGLAAAIVAQVQAMQRACKDDQELEVFFHTGQETIRVVELYVPPAQLIVLTGHDSGRNLTRVISSPDAVQLVCKVIKVQPGAAPARVNFITPKKAD